MITHSVTAVVRMPPTSSVYLVRGSRARWRRRSAGRQTGDVRRFVRWRKSFEEWHIAGDAAKAANEVAAIAEAPTAREEESSVRKVTTITRIGIRGGKVLYARRRNRDRMPRKSRSGGGAGSGVATTTAAGGTRPTVDRPSQVGSIASAGATARTRCTGSDKQYRVRI
jgi:hypothetical protein